VIEENRGKFCKVKGCKRIARSRGYCSKHLKQYYDGKYMNKSNVDIELYVLPNCIRCDVAKKMLEKVNIIFDCYEHNHNENNVEYPVLQIKKSVWKGKEALLEIGKLINIA